MSPRSWADRRLGRHGRLKPMSGYVGQHMLTTLSVSAYADSMTTVADLGQAATSAEPALGLPAVAALRQLVEQLEAAQVQQARQAGWSWQDIAGCLGVTKQTVHRKYRSRTGG